MASILKCVSVILLLLLVKENACTLEDSNDAAYLQQLLKNLNVEVDPCEDFYAYACGNWSNNHPGFKEYLDMPGYMDFKVNQQLLQILLDQRNKSSVCEKVWNYYESCIQLTSPALNFYLRLVEPEVHFEWPIFRENLHKPWENETNFDWLSTIAALRVYGLNGVFITQHVNLRLTNGSHYLLEVHQHQPILPLTAKEVTDIFVNFGMSQEQSENVTSRIMTLEQQMANLTEAKFGDGAEEDDDYYTKSFKELTLKELIQRVPALDWRKYFEILLGHDVNEEREVLQTFALDFDYFNKLLSTLNATSNETVCYYIMLKFMYQLYAALPSEKYTSMSCIKHVRGHMPLAMNFLYDKFIYASKRAKSDAALLAMYNKLRTSFEHLVEQENRLKLNSSERAYILAELHSMHIKIGNVPEELSDKLVERYYEHIHINASNFYGNHLQLLKHNTRSQQAKLRNEFVPPSQRFYEHDAETSSSSSPIKIFDNAILVPYGYLQLPFFEAELSPLLQYSLLGFILAHEIVHAYDLFHIVYDQHGSYDHLGIAIAQHFLDFINCSAQNPSDSLSENMADVAGLRLAFETYFNDVVNDLQGDMGGPNLSQFASLTGLSARQLFFVNSVQFLCADILEISAMEVTALDLEHDMHDVRVRQNWANLEQFAEAFNCKKGASMHPERKCRLW